FAGQQIAVLQLYNGEDEPAGTDEFDFAKPTQALREKGFTVHRMTSLPSAADLARVLARSSQLWVISGRKGPGIGYDHLDVIKSFFEEGHGLYLWGDNEPFQLEANQVAVGLFGAAV